MNNKRSDLFGELDLFKRMVENVPAYGKFLRAQKFNYHRVKNISDLKNVPTTDKKNYIDKFDLKELAWNGCLSDSDYIVNSSGSTGKPYFWPRSEASDKDSAKMYEIIFKEVFSVGEKPILFINSFGQGSWIAGNEAFLSTMNLSKKGMPITAINSGIEQSLIIDQLIRLAPFFTNVVFAGYPPFIKETFELLNQRNKNILKKHSVYAVVGGESVSERWRENTKNTLKYAKKVEVVSIYGMSDGGGILAFETPVTKYIRKQIFKSKDSLRIFGGRHNTALFQYDPMTRHFTTGEQGQLLIHVKNGLPLFNYDTKDSGGIVQFSEGISQFYDNSSQKTGLKKFEKYPFVYLLGRSDYAVTFYGLNIYPEHIRAAIDELTDKDITGRFVLEKRENKDAQPELIVNFELAENRKAASLVNKKRFIAEHIFQTLPKYNSEYAKLVRSINKRAMPKIKFKKFGEIGYKAGKKHKWVKKD
ncbi:phenylacetate--CoA ligase family protein [Candidatus Saccharibacteria bacterium]|nr:phenylacetate--CoA ligase family protein [Candidatus Saccharibacteria bacterium]